MKEPIFYKGEGDSETFVFVSARSAERYLEPIDVLSENGVCYDSEGLVLQVSIVKDARGIENTVIEDNGKSEYKSNELREHLVDTLEMFNYERSDLKTLKLSKIVRECLKFCTE